MKWDTFYQKPHTVETFLEQFYIHAEFVARISEEHPRNLLEVGVGRGTFTTIFSLLGISCVGIDNDPAVIERCRSFSRLFNLHDTIQTGDAFKLPFADSSFDVAISQGFFEHFCDADIHKLLDEQLRVAKKAIFSVPSKYYRIKDFGNERLMTLEGWRSILKGYNVEEAVPYCYRRLKKNFLRRLPLMYYFVVGK